MGLSRLLLGTALALCAATAAPAAEGEPELVKLTDLKPLAVEWGTGQDAYGLQTSVGPGKLDQGPCNAYNNSTAFWKDGLKIIREIKPDYRLPEGVKYESIMPDCFAVEGEFMTGVGIWVRGRNMYHWIDYEIPKGAVQFKGALYVSDDPNGWARPMRNGVYGNNQQFGFSATIDGNDQWPDDQKAGNEQENAANKRLEKEAAFRYAAQRLSKPVGSGEKLADVDIKIPAGAKRIRLRLQNSSWGDGNTNTELIINEGRFIIEKGEQAR